jgi:hypothetical protein
VVKSTDASGIIATAASGAASQAGSKPRPARPLDSRSLTLSSLGTDSSMFRSKNDRSSPHSINDPAYSFTSEKAEPVNPSLDEPEGRVFSIDDEKDDFSLLQRFQKPPIAPTAHKKEEHKRFSTPNASQTKVEVSIPARPTPSPIKLPRLVAPPAKSQLNFSLEIPSSQSEDLSLAAFTSKKKALFKELKESAAAAEERLPEVEKYFGQTGFSKAFATTQDHERRMRAAPVYKRKIDVDKFFAETDFDELWKEMQIDAGVAPEKVTKWNLEIKEEDNKFPRPYNFDYDELLQEILDDSFARHPHPPLSFRNDVDHRRINSMFQFMGEYVIRDNVRVAAPSTNRGCSCEGQCIPASCACQHKQVPVDPSDPTNKATVMQTIKTYHQSAKDSSITVLHPDYIANELRAENAHYEITECNEVCGCGPDCWNRVVGRGRTLSLEIYMTERCGFGVRYPHGPILKGQFIDVYLGEVITREELELREEAKPPDAPSYIYSLDWFNNPYTYHVDGEYFGSPMRFVNHSCSPNARSFSVQTHQGDKYVYHLAFFAIRDIPAGEQITIDYAPQDAIRVEDEDDRVAAVVGSDMSRSSSNSSAIDVVMSGAPSIDPEDEIRSNAGSRSSKSSKSSKSGASGKSKGKSKASEVQQINRVPSAAPESIVEEEGRSRCYCGAPNCRTWLWRAGGRQRRRRRNH